MAQLSLFIDPEIISLQGFVERRKIWLKDAKANKQLTLARVLQDNIDRTEQLIKNKLA